MAVGAEVVPDIITPYATLFDGALSFLKWREAWRQTHWIVVLDRTDSHFADAVNVLNQEYVSDRVDAELPALPRWPDGMMCCSTRRDGERSRGNRARVQLCCVL